MDYKRRLALIALYTEDKKLLLQKRDMNAPTFPGYWGFFGGGIEKDENPNDAIKREIFEELKIKVLHPRLLNRFEMEQDGGIVEKYIFLEPLKDTLEKLKKQQSEGESLGLFAIEEIYTLKFPKVNWPILRDISEDFKRK